MKITKVDSLVHVIRGQRVMIDRDLAELYGTPTGKINQAVKRHPTRFPEDFMFRLHPAEAFRLISQTGIPKKGRGGQRFLPNVFTEQGVAMLSSVLHSERAVAIHEVLAAFKRMESREE